MVGHPVNISRVKEDRNLSFNPNSIDDQQLAPSTALSKKATPTTAATSSDRTEDESSDGSQCFLLPENE